MIKHSKVRCFECDQCSEKCADISVLRKHINIKHNKVMCFECDQCSDKCSNRSVLRKHVKMKHSKVVCLNVTNVVTNVPIEVS